MKKFTLKSLSFVLALVLLVSCLAFVGCNNDDEEYKNDPASAMKLINKAEDQLETYRMTMKLWQFQSEDELQSNVDAGTNYKMSVQEFDKNNFCLHVPDTMDFDYVVCDNMVYVVGERIDNGFGMFLPSANGNMIAINGMEKYAFTDDEYDAVMASLIGIQMKIEKDHLKTVTITKLDDGKIKLSVTEMSDKYFEDTVISGEMTVFKITSEIIFDSQGRYLQGSNRQDYRIQYEYDNGQEIVQVDETWYTYTEATYEYENISVSAPENANEYELVDVDWNN